eukprot:613363-Pelagomonas_calceolata.AAC.1
MMPVLPRFNASCYSSLELQPLMCLSFKHFQLTWMPLNALDAPQLTLLQNSFTLASAFKLVLTGLCCRNVDMKLYTSMFHAAVRFCNT